MQITGHHEEEPTKIKCSRERLTEASYIEIIRHKHNLVTFTVHEVFKHKLKICVGYKK